MKRHFRGDNIDLELQVSIPKRVSEVLKRGKIKFV